MNPKELRIGNWVCGSTKNKYYEQVRMVGVKTIDTSLVIDEPSYYSGIPLIPEILIKAGFTKVTLDRDVFYELRLNQTTKLLYSLSVMSLGIEGVSQYHWYHMNIEHLHQLQNLYHSLTGKELRIKLDNI